MEVMTVTGTICAEELGVTLPHEHLLLDIRDVWQEPTEASRKPLVDAPITLSNLHLLRRDPLVSKVNLVLDDEEIAVEEILQFKKAGGKTLVEVTPKDMGRDARGLQRIAHATGLNIIMGCGYYFTGAAHLADRKAEQIAEELIKEIREGVGDTGIRPGVIGEIGTGSPISEADMKVLRAVAYAHLQTGLPIIIHVDPTGREGLRILDILEDEGVKPRHIVMGHMDCLMDLDYNKEIAERGAYVAYDNFGSEQYYMYSSMYNPVLPRDTDRVRGVVELIKLGYLSQILLSLDICTKLGLTKYGGWGYAHLSSEIEWLLSLSGLSKDEIQIMRVQNPMRALIPATNPGRKEAINA